MKRFHARVAVVKALKEKGLWVEENDNPMTIPLCAYARLDLTCVRRADELTPTTGNRAILSKLS
jgi:hypothetical protein